jgi:eukaryotic-like serine/threonine-protein kinase
MFLKSRAVSQPRDGAHKPMNAMVRQRAMEHMAETIAHVPEQDSGPDRHSGTDAMTLPQSKSAQRYSLASGSRPLEGYTIKRAIGRGGFGEVYYATSDAGKEVALKLITRNHDVERRGVVQCMNLKSPHLITIFDIKDNEAGDTFVVMEYVAGPSLANILATHPKGLPLNDVRAWLKGLVDGVTYLHDHGIVHRDLKPANIFLEEGVVKIGDYGLSKAISQSRDSGHSESVGTCHYMAPEISTGKYQKPIDIYAIGIILHEMITGRVPFDGESVGEVLMKHLTARPDLSGLMEPYRSIVARAIAKDPNHRPARAQDLLLPGDAPKDPDLRFIGASKDPTPKLNAPAADGVFIADASPAKPADDVIRIGEEDPVFYIGPNTMPPRPVVRRASIAQRVWGGLPVARAARARKAAKGEPRVNHRVPPPPPVAAVRPPAPPPLEPPPAPSGRVRVAELAASMLWATPAAFLSSSLALPLVPWFDNPLPIDPGQLVFLFAMTLLGCWSVLVPSKMWEGREVDTGLKRLTMLALGLAMGVGGLILGLWSRSMRVPAWHLDGFDPRLVSFSEHGFSGNLTGPIAFVGFFALTLTLNRWWKLTARDRRARFRFLPVIFTGAVAALVGAFLPTPPSPWGAIAVTLIAIIVQIVSPWDRAAAEYALAVQRRLV